MLALLSAAAIALTIDRGSKALLFRQIFPRPQLKTRTVTFGMCPSYNHRSMLTIHPLSVRLLLLLAGLVSAILLVTLHPYFESNLSALALGATLGGACANLLDELQHNGIRDFIRLPGLSAFNIADIAILGGLTLTLATASP